MLKGIGRRFTSAHAIALLALFVALAALRMPPAPSTARC
jgi:hypothetical protein